MNKTIDKPDWLKIDISSTNKTKQIKSITSNNKIHTVCQEAKCPNKSECWRNKEATILILGDKCTRSCKFCAVEQTINHSPTNDQEPKKVAKAINKMDLEYCVITSVTRDDLPDGGASIWAKTIKNIKRHNPDCNVEVLIPDFQGNAKSLKQVIDAKPDVLAHNIETVPNLYSNIRPEANYNQSLEVISKANKSGLITKSGLMVGLGETNQQIVDVMKDAHNAGCKLFTIGQYLKPTRDNYPVQRYVTPKQFKEFKKIGLDIGFIDIKSGPLVRSSYKANEMYESYLKWTSTE